MTSRVLAGALLSLVVAGCGPILEGTYKGTSTFSEACSDGSGGASSGSVTWVVDVLSGHQLSISTGGTCSPLAADISQSGSAATLRQKICPPLTTGGLTGNATMIGGTLTWTGPDTLSVAQQLNVQYSGSYNGSCSANQSGTLNRQP